MAAGLLLRSVGEFGWGDIPEPDPTEDQVVVQALWTGMCGTDIHIADGHHPRARFPLAIGHEVVARVVSGPQSGRRVFVDPLDACGTCAACLRGTSNICDRGGVLGIDRHGALAGRLAVSSERLHELPAIVPDHVAPLCEPLAVAIHAVRRVPHLDGATVVVVGAGPIGLLLAHVARRAGAAVLITEVAPSRRSAAVALGFELLDAEKPLENLIVLTGGRLADALFDAAAARDLAPTLHAWVRPGGWISIVGIHRQVVPVDLQAILFRELVVIGHRVYLPVDVRAAVAMLGEDLGVLGALVTHRNAAEEVPEVIEQMRAGEGIKFVVACPA